MLCRPGLNASNSIFRSEKMLLIKRDYTKKDPAPPANLLGVIIVCLLKQKTARAFHYTGIAKKEKPQITYGRETVLLRQ